MCQRIFVLVLLVLTGTLAAEPARLELEQHLRPLRQEVCELASQVEVVCGEASELVQQGQEAAQWVMTAEEGERLLEELHQWRDELAQILEAELAD